MVPALCYVCLPPQPDTRAKFQIDLEPDTNANLMQNITFRRVQTRNNYECGFSFALYACTVPEAPASVTLEDCHSIGDRMGSFNVESISSNVSGHILLKDCSSTGGSGPGLWIRGKDAKGASLQVTNMRLVNTATKMWIADGAAGRFPVSISVNGKNIGAQGGVHFTNLTVIDQLETLPGGSLQPGPLEATSKRAWLNATVPKGLAGISGDVTVVNSHGCSEIVKVGPGAAKNVSLKVTCKQEEHEHEQEREQEQAQGGSMSTRRGEDRSPLKNDDDGGHSSSSSSSSSAAALGFTSVPRVRSMEPGAGRLTLGGGGGREVRITVSAEALRAHAAVLAKDLLHLAGLSTTVTPSSSSTAATDDSGCTIALVLNATMVDSDNEYYRYTLSVDDSGATVTGASVPAIAHGTATLLQQLRRSGGSGVAQVNHTTVSDFSTVQWTGFMYDLARDPVDLRTFKNLIDLCRFYKMRFMHIFATAESGWRLPIAPDATVTVPVVFQGLIYEGQFDRWWKGSDNGVNFTLSHTGNGTWTIQSADPAVSTFAGVRERSKKTSFLCAILY